MRCPDSKDPSYLSAIQIVETGRYKCADTWYKLSLLRQWSCSSLTIRHHTTNDVLAVLMIVRNFCRANLSRIAQESAKNLHYMVNSSIMVMEGMVDEWLMSGS